MSKMDECRFKELNLQRRNKTFPIIQPNYESYNSA